MKMTRILSLLLTLSLFLSPPAPAEEPRPEPLLIRGDTVWTKDITIDRAVRVQKGTLSVVPGVRVTFTASGSIEVEKEGVLAARGTAERPVCFTGENCGRIVVHGGGLTLEFCEFTGVATPSQNREIWLDVNSGEVPVVLRHCRAVSCGSAWLTPGGRLEVSGCDFRGGRGALVVRGGVGKVLLSDNTMEGSGITVTGDGAKSETVLSGNVVIGAMVYHAREDRIVVEGNYVHQPKPGNTYGLLRVKGVTRNNVLRGGSWASAGLGGEITGNVFVSLPHEEILKAKESFDKNCTHEHICGLLPDSRVTRNIFVGASYGAIMGIGPNTGSGSVIRNNTFDMHGHGDPVFLNHLPKVDPKDIRISSNVFMRSSGLWDEKGIPDSATYIDFNLWSDAGKPRPYGKGGRFQKVVMTARKPGEEGFGGRDVPPFGQDDRQSAPTEVVVNPDVEFPFSDEEMLARKHTVGEVLKVYREAYTPRAGSPALDAGDPAHGDDPAVRDGKPDVGAVERTEP